MALSIGGSCKQIGLGSSADLCSSVSVRLAHFITEQKSTPSKATQSYRLVTGTGLEKAQILTRPKQSKVNQLPWSGLHV